MKNKKIFIACDTKSIKKVKKIIKNTETNKIKVGYKFGLEFLNSKNGRNFVSKLKNKITFGDYKFSDIPNTCSSALKAIKDLRLDYCTIHISSGLDALKAAKKTSGRTKLVGVTILSSLNNKALKEIINKTKNSKIKIGYKFGLEFLNSKNGRHFVSKLKNKIIFGDYKLSDIPNTCASAIKSVSDLKFNYLTIHISSGLEALRAAKKVSGKTKLIGVTVLTSLNDKS